MDWNVCTYTCTYVRIYVDRYSCVCVHTCGSVFMCMCAYIWIVIHVYVCIYTRVSCTQVYTRTSTYNPRPHRGHQHWGGQGGVWGGRPCCGSTRTARELHTLAGKSEDFPSADMSGDESRDRGVTWIRAREPSGTWRGGLIGGSCSNSSRVSSLRVGSEGKVVWEEREGGREWDRVCVREEGGGGGRAEHVGRVWDRVCCIERVALVCRQSNVMDHSAHMCIESVGIECVASRESCKYVSSWTSLTTVHVCLSRTCDPVCCIELLHQCVASSVLYPVCCVQCVASSVLHRVVASNVLRPVCCIECVASSVLHPVCCIEWLHQVCAHTRQQSNVMDHSAHICALRSLRSSVLHRVCCTHMSAVKCYGLQCTCVYQTRDIECVASSVLQRVCCIKCIALTCQQVMYHRAHICALRSLRSSVLHRVCSTHMSVMDHRAHIYALRSSRSSTLHRVWCITCVAHTCQQSNIIDHSAHMCIEIIKIQCVASRVLHRVCCITCVASSVLNREHLQTHVSIHIKRHGLHSRNILGLVW